LPSRIAKKPVKKRGKNEHLFAEIRFDRIGDRRTRKGKQNRGGGKERLFFGKKRKIKQPGGVSQW